MNEQQAAELRAMRAEQEALKARLESLDARLGRFDAGAAAVEAAVTEVKAADESVPATPLIAPVPVPPVVPVVSAAPVVPVSPTVPPVPMPMAAALEMPVAVVPPVPLPPPPVTPPKPAPSSPSVPMPPPLPMMAAASRPEISAAVPIWSTTPPADAPPPIPPPPVTAKAADTPTESLEMRIGSTWFVRIGIVLVLTSLAFLGHYLYQNVIPHLGPVSKVGLLYLGAGALAGVGAWLERSQQAQDLPGLKNYARVVLAGGLAGIYYVTYAAHYYPNLRVVDSALVAGVMLLGWTGLMTWLADRRGSETLASIAVLLAYYTSAINEGVAEFTLFSNLALTGAAVFLLKRHLWKIFPFASILATYGSYAFWNYFHSYLGWRGLESPPDHAANGGGGFWIECAFLLVYWLLFTWTVFTADERVLPPLRRAGFVTLNNSAFFLLVTWLVAAKHGEQFWAWSLGFGVVLLALSEFCRRWPRYLDSATEDAYLLQGVLAVTLGLIAKFGQTGWQLSLVLAVQSVTLLFAANRRRTRVLLWFSVVLSLLTFLWTFAVLSTHWTSAGLPREIWVTGLGVGIFLVLAAWLARTMFERQDEPQRATPYSRLLAMGPAFYSLVGLGVWLELYVLSITDHLTFAPLLATIAVVLTASVYGLRVRAIPIYAQGYLFVAFCQWLAQTTDTFGGPEIVKPPALDFCWLLVAVLALGHWWDRLPGTTLYSRNTTGRGWSYADAVLAVLVAHAWIYAMFPTDSAGRTLRTAALAALSLGILGYAVVTRYRALAVAGQFPLIVSIGSFTRLWIEDAGVHGPWDRWLLLAPCLVILATLAAARWLFPPEKLSEPPGRFGVIAYEAAAMGMLIAWGSRYVEREFLFTFFCVTGAAVFALGGLYREKRWLLWSYVPAVAALGTFWLPYTEADRHSLWHLLGIVVLGAQQYFGKRRLPETLSAVFPCRVQGAFMISATLCAWGLVNAEMSRWHGTAFTLAASWSLFALAVFAVAFVLHERVYRWMTLLILGAALAHIVIVDIWQLESLGRVLGMLFLGLVLLGVGFFYNKYSAKLRDLF